MKKISIVFVCLLCIGQILSARTGSVSGLVVDSLGRLPIEGAYVSLAEIQKTTSTDIRGRYNFQDLPEGRYTLVVSSLSYQEVKKTIQVIGGESTFIELKLSPIGLDIPAVTISSIRNPGEEFQSISALDIKLRPVQSSQDVLRQVPGLVIAQHAGGGKAEQIFLRGFDIDHGTDINIQVDGLPVNMVSHAHGQGYSDLHFLIPELIEKVNFAKGPYQEQYGNFATAGQVAFETKKTLSQNMLKLEAGSFNTLRAVGMLNLLPKSSNQSLYAAGEYVRSDGFFESSQDFHRVNGSLRFHSLAGENTIIDASVSAFQSEWTASGQIPERAIQQGLITRFGAIDDTEGGNTSRYQAQFSLKHALQNGGSFSQQFYWINYQFELYSNFTFFLEDPINGDQIRQKEDRNVLGYKNSWQNELQLGNLSVQTEIGAEVRHDIIRDNELSYTLQRTTVLRPVVFGDVDETNIGLFWRNSIALSDQLDLSVGLRYDYFRYTYQDLLEVGKDQLKNTRGMVNPKLNLQYTPSEKVLLYFKAGTGFHSNDSRLVLESQADDILPRAFGGDLGVVLKPNSNSLIQIGIWGLDLQQEFVYVGDAGIVEASGKSRRMGVDLSFRSQLTSWLYADLDANYTYARAREEADGEDFIPLAPSFTSIGGLRGKWDQLEVGLRYRYLADRPANEDNSLTAEGFFIVDAIGSYRFKQFEIRLSLENLLDTAWKEAQFETESRLAFETVPVSEIHFTPGAPFAARIGFSYFFN